MIIIALIKRRKTHELYASLFEKNWITVTQGYFVPNFGWNWSSGSGIEEFLNFAIS